MKMDALTHPKAMGKALAPKRSINAPTDGGPMIVPTAIADNEGCVGADVGRGGEAVAKNRRAQCVCCDSESSGHEDDEPDARRARE